MAVVEVWLNKLRIAVLPDPTPTAGTDPTTFPVADWLLPNALPDVLLDVLPVTVTMLGSAAVEDAASCTVSEEGGAAGAVPAWRR